jgi:hypothetical protein
MPNCFTLARKVDPTQPVPLAVVDAELCAHCGVEPHPTLYYRQWYDSIGLGLAMGMSWDRMREIFTAVPDDTEAVDMVNWFEANYVCSAWYQPRSFGK